MSDIVFLLLGIGIGLAMRLIVAVLDVAIKQVEYHVPRS